MKRPAALAFVGTLFAGVLHLAAAASAQTTTCSECELELTDTDGIVLGPDGSSMEIEFTAGTTPNGDCWLFPTGCIPVRRCSFAWRIEWNTGLYGETVQTMYGARNGSGAPIGTQHDTSPLTVGPSQSGALGDRATIACNTQYYVDMTMTFSNGAQPLLANGLVRCLICEQVNQPPGGNQ